MPAIPIIGAVAAVVGAGAAVVGTINSANAEKKANAAQQQSIAMERQKTQLQSMRQRMDAIRTARDAYANTQQAAENQGVSSSSAAQGGQGSIFSQMTGNLSFLDQYGFLSDQSAKFIGQAQNYQSKASMWNSVAGAGFELYSTAGGAKAIGKGFGI